MPRPGRRCRIVRPTALLLAAGLVLLPSLAFATELGPVDSRVIFVFDMRTPGWLVKAKLRLLPTLGPIPVWDAAGTIRCDGDGCPGRRARITGNTRAGGVGFGFQASFRGGTTCTFGGTIADPNATNAYHCVDAAGNPTLDDTFHVGLCRCLDRHPGTPDAFCATDPCPF